MSSLLDTAVELAYDAGEILKLYWGKLKQIEEKSHASDLVTEADKKSEELICSALKKLHPTHGILAEESGLSNGADYLWVIDPLDGTTNYTHQFPFVAISIGILLKKEPIAGVVFNPILNELFIAEKKAGATFNGLPMEVSSTQTLSSSLLATGFPYVQKERNFKAFCHLTEITHGVRRAGAAAIDMAYVACGRLDGFWEKGLKPWDMAAGQVLIEEAGGKLSHYDGTDLDLYKEEIAATNGRIHKELLKELQQF